MNQTNRTITVLGCGYVGLVTAALLATLGIKVYILDPNQDRINSVRSGKAFFYEEGINELLSLNVSSGTLIPTDSYKEAIPTSRIIISAVGTPDKVDGSSDLSYVMDAARSTAEHANDEAIYVQKSTVPVGTGSQIIKLFNSGKKHIDYVSNPEFLREGSALKDSLWFDRVIVGGGSIDSHQTIIDLYKLIEQKRRSIASLSKIASPSELGNGEYISTDLESAELIKVASNAFLALKISFANSMAKLADNVNADINEVMNGVGADPRIGKAFLNAGRGYGGGCFPKDVSGLIDSSQKRGIDMRIIKAAKEVNDSMPEYVVSKIVKALVHRSVADCQISILGLAFKSGTSDVRRSPSIQIANLLAGRGAKVNVYDPKANQEAAHHLDSEIAILSNAVDAIKGSDVVIIGTNWAEFKNLEPRKYADLMDGNIFVDSMNCFEKAKIENANLHYVGIGRSGTNFPASKTAPSKMHVIDEHK
jgi:UDPglucose 6-dehydrogenase